MRVFVRKSDIEKEDTTSSKKESEQLKLHKLPKDQLKKQYWWMVEPVEKVFLKELDVCWSLSKEPFSTGKYMKKIETKYVEIIKEDSINR